MQSATFTGNQIFNKLSPRLLQLVGENAPINYILKFISNFVMGKESNNPFLSSNHSFVPTVLARK